MQKQKGFTIIELLVVVAIIAVLTGIVLVNVTKYINKGKDSSIRGNLSSIVTNSAVYFDTNGTYTAFCASSYFTVPGAEIIKANSGSVSADVICVGTDTAMCACASLTATPGNVFCVDSTGYKKEGTVKCLEVCRSPGLCV